MINSLDFVFYAQAHSEESQKILDALFNTIDSEIIVDRHKLSFKPDTKEIIVERASNDVLNAHKIIKCSIPYELMQQLLDGSFDDLTGLKWLE